MARSGRSKKLLLTARKWSLPAAVRKREFPWIGAAPWAIELALLFSLLLLVEFILPGHMQLGAISPHPFWMPVLLLSVQYGTTGGVAAALVAIGLGALIGWPVQTGGEDFYDYSLRVWREPILWLGAAVILGTLRTQQADKLEALRDRLIAVDAQRQSIGNLFNELRSHCENLERRIACAQDRSIEAGLSVLTGVRDCTPECLRGSLTAAVELLLGPARYTVLLYRDGHLVESADCGSGAAVLGRCPSADKLPADFAEAFAYEKRVLSILREDDARVLAGTALFAAPILAGHRVLGALLIRTMQASRIGRDTENSIRAICRELGLALSRDQAALISSADVAQDKITVLELSRSTPRRGKPRSNIRPRPSMVG